METVLPPGVLNVVAVRPMARRLAVTWIRTASPSPAPRLKMSMLYAGQSNTKQVWLERASSAQPGLVDCRNLEAAADMFILASSNQGEICSATSQLLIERCTKDTLVEKLTQMPCRDAAGEPLDPTLKIAAIVSTSYAANVIRFVEASRKTARRVAEGDQVTVNGVAALCCRPFSMTYLKCSLGETSDLVLSVVVLSRAHRIAESLRPARFRSTRWASKRDGAVRPVQAVRLWA